MRHKPAPQHMPPPYQHSWAHCYWQVCLNHQGAHFAQSATLVIDAETPEANRSAFLTLMYTAWLAAVNALRLAGQLETKSMPNWK
jgi:hypothetical protein